MSNESVPVTGVVNADNLAEWFWDEVYNFGLNLSENNALLDWETDHPGEEFPDDFTVEEPEILLGDWKLSGKIYVPVQDGSDGFSAVLD